MAKLAELRTQAKAVGLSGASRLKKQELEDALELVVVWRGDSLVRKLGLKYLQTCPVAEWEQTGRGRYRKWSPRAWRVPRFRLGGIEPLSREVAEAAHQRRIEAGRQADQGAMERVANAIGALPSSRTARAVLRGQRDPDEAELIAFKIRLRHEFSDYDELLTVTGDRDYARGAMRRDQPEFQDWDNYQAYYGFGGEVAAALARVLSDPRESHPLWFKEAEIAVRRAVARGRLNLAVLTYEAICQAIETWRDERTHEP